MSEKIYGFHAIEEALKRASSGSTLYLIRQGGERVNKLEALARATGKVTVKKLKKDELEKMYFGVDLRGALLVVPTERGSSSRVNETTVEEFCSSLKEDQNSLVLILDGITDPHNLGAILRSADQFGVDLVILPERRSVQANETVIKVSSGAAQYVKLAVVTNLTREIKALKDNGFWVYGADMSGCDSYNEKFTSRTAIVMGAEGSGISSLVKKNCDEIVSIPMYGHIDSLNVSVAAGILLYEFRRNNKRFKH